MRIGELAARAGCDVETLRFYEREGLLAAPAREASGYRRYDDRALDTVRFIRHCRSLDIPLHHHEKWNGTGYPLKLQGDLIPLCARIFAVVDVYDALTSNRPYHEAAAQDVALAHIKEQSGIAFDPDVVRQFLEMVGEG